MGFENTQIKIYHVHMKINITFIVIQYIEKLRTLYFAGLKQNRDLSFILVLLIYCLLF